MEGNKVSDKELAYKLIDSLPQQKLAYVIGYLQGLSADEAADDALSYIRWIMEG